MSHGILENDRGMVWGTTWHKLEQYEQLDRAVTYEEAIEVLDYPIEKRQLMRMGMDGWEPADAWEIVRGDDNTVLAPMVGSQFVAENNRNLLEMVHAQFVDRADGLEYESVGTLFGGAVAFVNLKLDEHQVKGDKSPTVNRLMYYNPIGRGAYKALAHDVRVVCNNTLQMAEVKGKELNSVLRVRHTRTAGERITAHLIDLAEIHMQVKLHQEMLNHMATIKMDAKAVDAYLEHMFVTDEKMSESAITRRVNKRGEILTLFEGDQHLTGATKRSTYAMLQATTDYFDHTIARSDSDMGTAQWNGLVGTGAAEKTKALNYLLKVA